MVSAMAPYSGFELIFDAALIEYARQTGINLATYPPAEKLMNCGSPDAVIQLLQEKMQGFKVFRDRGSKLIKWLRPLVQVIYLVSGVLGHTTDPVSPRDLICEHVFINLSSGDDESREGHLCEHSCPPFGTHPPFFIRPHRCNVSIIRPQAGSARATTLSWIFLNASEISSIESKFM
jgi:hypothetical protein